MSKVEVRHFSFLKPSGIVHSDIDVASIVAILAFVRLVYVCADQRFNFLTTQNLEPRVHGRGRDPDSLDDLHFGVTQEMLYARKIVPVAGTYTRLGSSFRSALCHNFFV